MDEAIKTTELQLATLMYLENSKGHRLRALEEMANHSRQLHVIPPLLLKRTRSNDLELPAKCAKKSKVIAVDPPAVLTVVQPAPSLLTSVINAFKF